MKKIIVLLIALVILAVTSVAMADVIHLKDGKSYVFDDNTYQNDHVRLDYHTTRNPGTHVELVDGGYVGQLDSHHNATITMTGGSVGNKFYASGHSSITITDGWVGGVLAAEGASTVTMTGGVAANYFQARNHGTIIMTGGMVKRGLEALYDSTITISGGTIEGGFGSGIGAGINGTIYLEGVDFEVDGTALSDGDKLSDFVPLVEYRPDGIILDHYTGTITGILADGSVLNNLFAIYNTGALEGIGNIIIVHKPVTIKVDVDVRPSSCPNPVNVKSKGVLPVAILGTEEFDVSTIDIASIFLNGVQAIRSILEDVSAPFDDPNECECFTNGPDGFMDLTLKFKTQQIVESLGEVNTGDILTLPLTGVLNDGTPIEGADCVVIVGRHKPINKADINKDGLVNTVDIAIVAENWLQSSVVDE